MAGVSARASAANARALGQIRYFAGATAYGRDVPDAEIQILDAGHFAMDERLDEIVDLTRGFLASPDIGAV